MMRVRTSTSAFDRRLTVLLALVACGIGWRARTEGLRFRVAVDGPVSVWAVGVHEDPTARASVTPACCWTSLPSPSALAMADDAVGANSGQDAFAYSRWYQTANQSSTGGNGDRVTLTVAFVPDGTPVSALVTTAQCGGAPPPALPSNLLATMDALYGARAPWENAVRDALQDWSDACGADLQFVDYDDGAPVLSICDADHRGELGVRADIRICGRNIDGAPSTPNALARTYFPDHGDIVIDTANATPGGPLAAVASLRGILAHEIGHALGLQHACPLNQSKIMEPVVPVGLTGPQSDDILGAQSLYGDRFEPNQTALFAPALPVPTSGASSFQKLGLHVGYFFPEEDWYKITLTESADVYISAAPSGGNSITSYPTNPPLDVCSPFPPFGTPQLNPQTVSDLSLEIFDSLGAPIGDPSSGAQQPLGQGESVLLRNVYVPASGTKDLYVRVSQQSPGIVPGYPTLAYTQLYSLDVVLQSIGPPGALIVDWSEPVAPCAPGAGVFSTVQDAVACAPVGATIAVRPGFYVHHGFDAVGKGLTIVATANDVVETSLSYQPAPGVPQCADVPATGTYCGIRLDGGSSLSGFTLYSAARRVAVVRAQGSPHVSRCYFSLVGGGSVAISGGQPLIEDSAFVSYRSKLLDCDGAIVRGCTFYSALKPELAGVALLEDSIVWQRGFDGSNPGNMPVTPPAGGVPLVIDNAIVAGPAAALTSGTYTTNASNISPQFPEQEALLLPATNPVLMSFGSVSLADLAPAPTSPALDAATTRPFESARDLRGQPRRRRAKDVGAIELHDQVVTIGPGGTGTSPGAVLWPGTFDGLVVTVFTDGVQGATFDEVAAPPGAWMSTSTTSETNRYRSAPYFVGIQAYPTASVAPSVAPFLHVDVFACPGCLFALGPLPTDGAQINLPYVGGLAGLTLRVQAFAISPAAQNGAFAASNASVFHFQ